MLAIDAGHLRQLAPPQTGLRAERQHEIIEGMGTAFAATLDRFEINTPLRITHFLAQVAHESDGFCTTEEYASGRAYEGRRDLGNTETGDGPLFKGRGLIQLTGRANYKTTGDKLGMDLVRQPLSVNDPYVYLLVSCVFWSQKCINQYCDADDIISVTHRVNGGQNGLDSRKAYLVKAKALVAVLAAGNAAPPGGGMVVLHRGLTGDAVANLQRLLSSVGYPVALDGDFGPATEVAVKHFQAASGLTDDGIVGSVTWAKMQSLAKAA
ncbi:MAG TPA: peptidoglycan-binding protein [Acetobacteraceae bacterium]|nr:peptidoglycan-binding protein [Acetobacteraceae bacterium]